MSFKISVVVPSGLSAIPEQLETAITTATRSSTVLVTNEAIGYAPRKFGTLKRSIRGEVTSAFTGTILQDATVAKYGKWVENGTGIYGPLGTPIVPINAKFLAWQGPKGWCRAKSVRGMKPRPYMEPAYMKNQENVNQIFQKNINEAIGGV
jgi:HK97 gp10 family phage protein